MSKYFYLPCYTDTDYQLAVSETVKERMHSIIKNFSAKQKALDNFNAVKNETGFLNALMHSVKFHHDVIIHLTKDDLKTPAYYYNNFYRVFDQHSVRVLLMRYSDAVNNNKLDKAETYVNEFIKNYQKQIRKEQDNEKY